MNSVLKQDIRSICKKQYIWEPNEWKGEARLTDKSILLEWEMFFWHSRCWLEYLVKYNTLKCELWYCWQTLFQRPTMSKHCGIETPLTRLRVHSRLLKYRVIHSIRQEALWLMQIHTALEISIFPNSSTLPPIVVSWTFHRNPQNTRFVISWIVHS